MYKFRLLLLQIIPVLVAMACATREQPLVGTTKLIKDDLGREVAVPDSAVRIFPVTSSITEFLYLLTDDSRIIARTQNDSFPDRVLSKPVINNYPVDFEKIFALKPDLVLAKEGILNLEDAERIEKMGIPVYYMVFENIEDIIEAPRILGKILKVQERANKVSDSLAKDVEILRTKVAGKKRKSVLITISPEPVYVFGKDSYATGIIEAAGGTNAVDQVFNTPFPPLRREYILKIDPDVFITGQPEVFLQNYPELKNVRAFRNNHIGQIDGDLISRPGPRVGVTIRELQEIIYAK